MSMFSYCFQSVYSVHVHLLCTYVHSLTCRDAKLNVNHTGVHMWGCSQMWPFLSYGQCPVPSCPDKGSLSVLPTRRIRDFLTAWF